MAYTNVSSMRSTRYPLMGLGAEMYAAPIRRTARMGRHGPCPAGSTHVVIGGRDYGCVHVSSLKGLDGCSCGGPTNGCRCGPSLGQTAPGASTAGIMLPLIGVAGLVLWMGMSASKGHNVKTNHRRTRRNSTSTDKERAAILRVRRAGVKAPETDIKSFVRSVGPDTVLRASLSEIRSVAGAF